VEKLSLSQARRIALRAQALDKAGSPAPDQTRPLLGMIRRLGLLQLDSVSVLVRAHYLPLFSRLGGYDRRTLDELAGFDGVPPARRTRRLFEYWGHEASLLPVEMQPLLRWRMAQAERGQGVWRGVAQIARDQPELVARLEQDVAERGPITASALAQEERRAGGWWGWGDTKRALEWLFWTGRITSAGRRGFMRLYDLPARTLPKPVVDTPTPEEADAVRALVIHAATALGVATAGDLRDYFRLPLAASQKALQELVEDWALVPLAVEGWRQEAYATPGQAVPRRAERAALLAPFDPLVWHRPRVQRLFGFDYRLEIYTPAEKRQHGYYVLPFLLGERLVARIDAKTERRHATLRVRSAHGEPGIRAEAVAGPLARELFSLATWLGLERIAVEEQGDLAAPLRDAVGASSVDAVSAEA
jgi:uncharacterized protein YcaQ